MCPQQEGGAKIRYGDVLIKALPNAVELSSLNNAYVCHDHLHGNRIAGVLIHLDGRILTLALQYRHR